jgi:putative sugar O-methyltransferase
MNKYGWEIPPGGITDKYEERCEAFVKSDELFANFKRDPDYTKVLEGNEVDVGLRALKGINQWGNALIKTISPIIDRLRENESIGNPQLVDFGEGVGIIAPSTLRYINTCAEIQQLLMGEKARRIIEIGGGYGGLCKIFDVFFGGFDSYTIIDSPWASKLTEKYLSKFNLSDRTTCVSVADLDKVDTKDIDLLIADSSLSECNLETQLMYTDRFVQHAKSIYMVYNTVHTQGGFYRFNRVVEGLTKKFDVQAMSISQPYMITSESLGYGPEQLLGGLIIYARRKE